MTSPYRNGPGGNGRRGRTTPYILSQIQAASQNLDHVFVTPEQFGAVGNWRVDDWAALSEAAALGVPVFCNPAKVYGTSQQIVGADGTFFTDGRLGRTLGGTSGSRIQALNTFSGADSVIAFPAGTDGGGVGINVGGLGGISSPLAGVSIADGCYGIKVEHAWIGNLSDSAVRMVGHPFGCTVDDNTLGYDVTGRTLTVPTGVLHIVGTDHKIGVNEVNGGPAWIGGPPNGYDRVAYPGQYFRCGVYLNGQFVVFGMTVPEFCDTGWYIDTAATENRLGNGARSDYSAGPGVYVLGSENSFEDFQVNNCGFDFNHSGVLYDGAVHAGTAARNHWARYGFNLAGALWQARYGWSDTVTGNGTQNENVLESHTIRPEYCFYDTVNRAEPRSPIKPGGEGPLRDRPPSRWANGQHWTDTERGVDAHASGGKWLDSFNGVSGNLCTPKLAEGIGGSLQIQNADSTCTVGGALWVNAGTAGQLMPFGVMAIAVCTAAGATAGYINVATVADTLGHYTACVAGQDYTFTVETVAASRPAVVSLLVNYYNSSNVYLGSSALIAATGGGTNSTTAATDTYWNHVTAPAGAAFQQPLFRLTAAGITAGDSYPLNGVTIIADTAGVVTGYVRP